MQPICRPLRLRLGLLAVVWMLTLALGSSAAPAGAANTHPSAADHPMIAAPSATTPLLNAAFDWEGVQTGWFAAPDTRDEGLFGMSVLIDGDTLVIGAPGALEGAYVYRRAAAPGAGWDFVRKLSPPAGADYTWGLAVAGDLIAIGGSRQQPGTNSYRDAVFLLARNQGGPDQWGQLAVIDEPDGPFLAPFFGQSIVITDNAVLVGTPGANGNAGVIHVFAPADPQNPTTWSRVAQLTADDTAGSDRFGARMAISGDTLAVSAPQYTNHSDDPGVVYLFERDPEVAAGWRQIARRSASDASYKDTFGSTMALRGDQLLVGRGYGGPVYLFERDAGGADQWGQTARILPAAPTETHYFGDALAIGAGRLFVSDSTATVGENTYQGMVYVFAPDPNNPGAWIEQTRIAPDYNRADDFFGTSIAVQGDDMLIGTHFGHYRYRRGAVAWLRLHLRPTPADDAATTDEDQPALIDVLANDTSPDEAGALIPGSVVVATPAANGSTSVDPETGAITYTPAPDFFGVDQFTYQVSAAVGTSRTATVRVTVRPINDPPTIGDPPPPQATSFSPYQLAIRGADIDPGDTLTFSADMLPTWLQLSAAGAGSATLSGMPTDANVGEQPVVVRVTDSGGLSATRAMTITVAPNHPPVFQAIQPQTARQGARYNLTVFAQEPDLGQRLSLRATILPSWLAATTGEDYLWLDGTPALADVGEHVVSLEATDPGGLTATASFTITVEPDRPEQPGPLIAMPLDPRQVGLRWQDGGAGELGFRVERRPAGGDWATLDQLPANTTVYTDTGLACGAWYDYRVVAFNTNWDSPPSAVSSAAAEQLALRSFAYTGAPVTIAGRSASAADLLVGAAGRILDLDARVDLDHPYVGALSLILRSPTGLELPLATHVGGAGHNFRGTIFDDEAEPAIWLSQAPFTGRFRPSSPLTALDNTEMAGLWQLRVQNDSGFPGALTGADLRVTVPDGCPGVPATPTPTATQTSTPTPTATSTPTPEPPQVIYVDVAAAGANTGRSWADAHPDLQAALARARAGDALWVRRGTYLPLAGADRTNTFTIPPGVQLYGGFAGGETSLDQRDWAANETILSGDIGAAGVAEDNSRTVVKIVDGGSATVLDGVTVTEGNLGVWVIEGGPTLRNLVIRDNTNGMIISSSSPALSDSRFVNNLTGDSNNSALGIQDSTVTFDQVEFRGNQGGSSGAINSFRSDLTMRDVRFIENQATFNYGGGGAIYSSYTTLRIDRGLFERNETTFHGGALSHSYSTTVLNDVTFRLNRAGASGGAISAYGGPMTLRNVVFEQNAAIGSNSQGGALAIGSAEVWIDGASFVGNRAELHGGAISTSGVVNILNTVFSGNRAVTGDGGALATCSSIRMIQSTLVNNQAAGQGGALADQCGWDPSLHNSIIWGNTAASNPQLARFYTDSPIRVQQSIVQGGYPGAGNRDADPRLIDSDGADGVVGTADDDLRPGAGSPAIDAGDNSLLYPDLITDRVGNQRRADDPQVADTGVGTAPIVDLGAYERLAGVAPTRTPTPTASATATPTPPPLPQVGLSFETDGGLQPIAEGAIIRVPLNNLFLAFNRPLDGYLLGAVRVLAEGDTPGFQNGGCATFDEGDQLMRANFRSIQYQQRRYILRYYTGEPSLPDGRYRVLVCDTVTGGYPLLDGDGDGVPGGSFIRDFTIDRTSPTPTPTWTSTATATPTATASPTPTATVGIGPGATIQITQTTGRAGSVFEARGVGFAPGQRVTVWVNGVQVGGAQAGPGGAFQLALATDPAAAAGFYRATIGPEGAGLAAAPPAATYQIHPRLPLRSAPGGATPITIPQAVGPLAPQQIFLPLLEV